METKTLRKILGILLILLVVIVTVSVIKFLPAILKVITLAGNIITIYYAVNYLIKNKQKKEKE